MKMPDIRILDEHVCGPSCKRVRNWNYKVTDMFIALGLIFRQSYFKQDSLSETANPSPRDPDCKKETTNSRRAIRIVIRDCKPPPRDPDCNQRLQTPAARSGL